MSTAPAERPELSTTEEQISKHAKVSAEAIKAYENEVSRARTIRSKEPIPNRYPWHCKIAVSHLLKLACSLQHSPQKNEKEKENVIIRVLTGTLTGHVYSPELLDGVFSFLEAGGEIRVLVWNTVDSIKNSRGDVAFLESLADQPGFKMRVIGTREFGEDINHFFVVGKEAYRLEAPHRYVDGVDFNDFVPEIPARICFNDKATAERLVALFDLIWDRLNDSVIGELELESSQQ